MHAWAGQIVTFFAYKVAPLAVTQPQPGRVTDPTREIIMYSGPTLISDSAQTFFSQTRLKAQVP